MTRIHPNTALALPGVPLEPDLNGASQNLSISDQYFFPHMKSARSTVTWPLPNNNNNNVPALDPLLFESSADHELLGPTVPRRSATLTRPIAINPHPPHRAFTTEFSTSPKNSRPKVRGRFTPLRRKEVQTVRKLGACIRCRMLKKPVRLSCFPSFPFISISLLQLSLSLSFISLSLSLLPLSLLIGLRLSSLRYFLSAPERVRVRHVVASKALVCGSNRVSGRASWRPWSFTPQVCHTRRPPSFPRACSGASARTD